MKSFLAFWTVTFKTSRTVSICIGDWLIEGRYQTVDIICTLYWVDKVVKSRPVWDFLVPFVVHEWSFAKHQIWSTIADRVNVTVMLLVSDAGIALGFWRLPPVYSFITDCAGWKDLLFLVLLCVIVFSVFSVAITSVLGTGDGLSSWSWIIMPLVKCNDTPYTDSGLWSPVTISVQPCNHSVIASLSFDV